MYEKTDEGKELAVFDKLGQIHSIKAFYKPDLSMSKGDSRSHLD